MTTGLEHLKIDHRHRNENRRGDRIRRIMKSRGAEDTRHKPIEQMNQEESDAFILEACSHPAKYADMILGVTLYPKQLEIMEAMLRYPKLAVAGCNSSGKTFTQSPFALWDLTMEDRIAIMEIAPTQNQSRGVFWRDMRGLYNNSPLAQSLLNNAEMHKTSIEVDEYRYAHAVNPGDVMNLRGYHADKMLFILDEGNGIDAEYFTAISGIAASGEISIVQLGNPTQNSGIFYDSFMEKDLGWHTMNISSFDSPNLLSLEVPDWFTDEDDAPGIILPENRRKLAYLVYLRKQYLAKRDRIPPLDIPEFQVLMDDLSIHMTRRMFVADKHAEWAKIAHPSWFGQVLGDFPPDSEYQLFSRKSLEAAAKPADWPINMSLEAHQNKFIAWGADPAGMGKSDWGLIGVCIDMDTMDHQIIHNDGYQGEDDFEQALADMSPLMQFTGWVNIDRMGAGERPAIEMKRWASQWGVDAFSFVSNSPSTNTQVFKSLKAQAYYYLRDLLEMGKITGLTDPLLKRQLTSIQYNISPRGQIDLESKRDMAKRGVASPDRADALVYAVFNFYMFAPFSGFMSG